jgi:antitoxin ParD1/3/4
MADVTMSISIPKKMMAYIEERVRSGEFASVSEFFRHLVRDDCKRRAEERLAVLLLEGENSGPAIRADGDWWDRRREELLAQARARMKKQT